MVQQKFVYKVQNGTPFYDSKEKKGYDVSRTNQIWNTTAILRILRDERYIGTYVMGKTEVIAVGGRRMKDKPEDLWHKIPNHHPAIVDETVFYDVQDLVKVRKTCKRENQVYPLKGKVICGCCQHYMQRNAKIETEFFCRTSQRLEFFPCSSLRVKESDLEEVVIAMFKNYLMLTQDEVTDIPETTEDIDALKVEKQELSQSFDMTQKLTKEIVDLFLDKIIIHEADNIEAKLKVADPFTAQIENQ